MRLTNTIRDAFVHAASGMSMATADEIERRIGYRIPSPHIDLLLGYIAEREAAVLAKLEGQEPVAMRYDFDGYGYKYIDSGSGSDWRSRIPDAEAVYAAPQQADRQRVPDGWKLVPMEPGEWVFADKVLGHDSHPNHKERMRRLYRAMLAAAPEAPVHADRQQGPEADHVVTQTCTDERPCIPCFTDNGLCAALATPEATAQEKSNG